jgi:DNA-binding response OmpR family regulator
VITARGSLDEREKGLRTEGIFDYLIKPFSPSEFLVIVDRLLAKLSQKG